MAHRRRTLAWLCAVCVTLGGALGVAAAAPNRSVVQFAGLAANDFQDALKLVIQQFEKENPDTEIENLILPGSLADKLIAMLATGTAPDVFWVSTGLFAEWGEAGFLHRLNDLERHYHTTFDLNDFWPGSLDTYRYMGQLYGMPREINMALMYYNRDLFDEVGIAYPGADPARALSWRSSFLEAARKLTRDADGDGQPDRFGWHFRKAWWEWFPILWSNGAQLFDENVTGAAFHSPQAVEALQYLVDLMYQQRVAPTPDDVKWLGLKADSQHYENLASGRVGMVIDNSIPMTFLRSQPEVNWDVAAIPGWTGKPRVNLASGGGFAMNAATSNPDAAFKWLAYVTGPQASRTWARTSGWVPARRTAATSPDFLRSDVPPSSLRLVVQDAVHVRPIPATPKWSEVIYRILVPGLNQLWSNQRPAKVVLDELAARVNTALQAK